MLYVRTWKRDLVCDLPVMIRTSLAGTKFDAPAFNLLDPQVTYTALTILFLLCKETIPGAVVPTPQCLRNTTWLSGD